MSHKPTFPVIEILEKTNRVDDSGLVPNRFLVNGESLYTSAEHPIVVHETSIGGDELVSVTVTLLARRVLIEQRVEDEAA